MQSSYAFSIRYTKSHQLLTFTATPYHRLFNLTSAIVLIFKCLFFTENNKFSPRGKNGTNRHDVGLAPKRAVGTIFTPAIVRVFWKVLQCFAFFPVLINSYHKKATVYKPAFRILRVRMITFKTSLTTAPTANCKKKEIYCFIFNCEFEFALQLFKSHGFIASCW